MLHGDTITGCVFPLYLEKARKKYFAWTNKCNQIFCAL